MAMRLRFSAPRRRGSTNNNAAAGSWLVGSSFWPGGTTTTARRQHPRFFLVQHRQRRSRTTTTVLRPFSSSSSSSFSPIAAGDHRRLRSGGSNNTPRVGVRRSSYNSKPPFSSYRAFASSSTIDPSSAVQDEESDETDDEYDDEEEEEQWDDIGSAAPDMYDEDDDDTPVEEQYSRKTPLEHILLRPGMYVGPNERLPSTSCWVLESSIPAPTTADTEHLLREHRLLDADDDTEGSAEPPSEQPLRMVRKECRLVPALGKVFDEILVNASDNRLRHPKTCTRIDVIIDPGDPDSDREPYIRVENDGKGIPVQIHRKENMYVPELLFGHLLTGSNFDDTQKRITGGRHGYGAKLANIFSKTFTVETLDSRKGLRYRQTWYNNMTESSPPEIEEVSEEDASGGDYTCISFVPDLARLTGGTEANIAEQDYAIMCRRVVDVAGCAGGKLQVTLNGVNVSQPSFHDYCQMYRSEKSKPVCFHQINARWNVGVGLSESGSFESVSFVNGMATTRGGTHIDVLLQQITKRLRERVAKMDAELGAFVSPAVIKRHLFVFCDAHIENPTFDSQMKEFLTSSPENFGSKYDLGNPFLRKLLATEEEGGPGIVEQIVKFARGRQQANLIKAVEGPKKSKSNVIGIEKLDDAHDAGTAAGWDCTIILTEGDSAKALAIAGLEEVGRARFGVFPLRGKFLNVRHASAKKLKDNKEVKALCKILGLDFKKTYDTVAERRKLRYGRVLLMTDQDNGKS